MESIFILLGVALVLGPPVLSIVSFLRSRRLEGELLLVRDDLTGARIHLRTLGERIAALENGGLRAPLPSQPSAVAPVADDMAPRSDESGEPVSPDDRGLADIPEPLPQDAIGTEGATVQSEPTPSAPPSFGPVPPPPMAASPPMRPDIEQALGGRWAVWVGGLALALGGLFLVRFSIEQGWFGPGARIFAGLMFSLALIVAGEWLRRRDTLADEVPLILGGLPAAHIPSVVTAAGVAALFGVVYAAYALYGFLSPFMAFVVLGAVGVAALFASALHGPTLAAAGLLGSYATPILVGGDGPAIGAVGFLLAVTASAFGVARILRTRWIAHGAVIGIAIWAALFVVGEGARDPWIPAIHILGMTALIVAFLVHDVHRGRAGEAVEPDNSDPFGLGALATAAGLAAFFVLVTREAAPTFAVSLGVVAALAWSGYRYAPVRPAYAMGVLLAAVALMLWPAAFIERITAVGVLGDFATDIVRRPRAIGVFLTLAAAFGLALAAAPILRLAQGPATARFNLFVVAPGAAAPLVMFLIAALRITRFEQDLPFAAAALLLALGLVMVGEGLLRLERKRGDTEHFGSGVYAASAAATLGVGLTLALSQGFLTVALSLCCLGIAWVTRARPIPLLRWACAAFALATLVHIVYEPRIAGAALGTTPIFNWLLIGYGLPTIAFVIAARWLRETGLDRPLVMVEAMACIFLALFLAAEIRHAFHGVSLGGINQPLLAEAGLYVATAFGLSVLFANRAEVLRAITLVTASRIASGAGVGLAILLLLLVSNPTLSGQRTFGPPLLGEIAIGYLLPALAATAAALYGPPTPVNLRWAVRFTALASGLFYVLFEVRRLFSGPDLTRTYISEPESYAYSAALLLYGVVVLLIGFRTGSRTIRLGSAAILTLAVVKVFVLDMAGLQGLLRALSFIGLGLALVGIGRMYQRLLRRLPPPAATPTPQPSVPSPP